MRLAEVSIKRPVFAIMMSVALVTLGIFSYRSLGVDLMPKTEPPTVNVRVNLTGASPEEIETQITKPPEEALNTISDIDELKTNSERGGVNANVTFNLERDMDSAIQDVRDKVAPLQVVWPRDTQLPRVTKQDPDAAPVVTFAISGRDPKELTEIGDTRINQVLETVHGIGGTQFFGDRRRQIQLLLDADRLTAYGLTADQVRAAVERQNVEIPGGTFISGPTEIALR